MNIRMTPGFEEDTVRSVLETDPPFEVSFTHIPYPEMSVGDCTRELKLSLGGDCYIKQGMHGSNGAWKREKKEVAIHWLIDAAINNFKVLGSHSRCSYILKETDKRSIQPNADASVD